MLQEAIIADLVKSFVLGLSLSITVIYFIPKYNDDRKNQSDSSSSSTDTPTISTENESLPQTDNLAEIKMNDDNENLMQEEPQLVRRRAKKNTKQEITTDIVDKLDRSPHLKKFFGVSEDNISDFRTSHPVNPPISPDIAKKLQQSPHLKKFFGVEQKEGEDEIDATRPNNTNNDQQNGEIEKEKLDDLDLSKLGDMSEGEMDILSLLTFAVGTFLFLALLLVINIATNGDFGRMVVGMFPKETSTLKIDHFLMKFRNH